MAFRWVTLALASVVAAGACTAGGDDDGGGRGGGTSGVMAQFPMGGTSGNASTGGVGGIGGMTGGTGGMTGGTGGIAGEGGTAGVGGGETCTGPGGTPTDRTFNAGSDANRNKVTPGALCERMSTIQCAAEAFCCCNPGRDEATCKQTMFQGCMNELFLDTIAADPKAGFDPAAAEVAFTEYERLSSICDSNVAIWGASTAGLRGIMKGSVPPGGSCTPSGFSIQDPTSLDMTQAAIALASCNAIESSACLPSLVPPWDCSPRVGAGPDSECFTDVNCLDGLYCDNPQPIMSLSLKECKQRKAGGAPCAQPNECASLACRGGMCAAVGDVQAAFCLK